LARIKNTRPLQFCLHGVIAAPTKSVPPRAGKPVAHAIFDPHQPTMTARAIFLKRQETTMTLEQYITIEHQIEELRAELNNAATPVERRLVEAELQAARAELTKLAEEELP